MVTHVLNPFDLNFCPERIALRGLFARDPI